MKKKYMSPEIVVFKTSSEGALLDTHTCGDADSKKGFFDEEEDDNLKSNDLWDDSKDNLWE